MAASEVLTVDRARGRPITRSIHPPITAMLLVKESSAVSSVDDDPLSTSV
jgi:hypothetical protein